MLQLVANTTTMGESVYNLIPPEQPVPVRPRKHKSCHPGKLDERTLVYPMGVPKHADSKRTFGKPDGMCAQHPKDFTRAHTGTATLPAPSPPSKTKSKLKAHTTTRKEKPIMNLHSGKNFITTNAVEAILSKPPAMQTELPYTTKKTYGKVPNYLRTNKMQVEAEKAQVTEYLRAQDGQVCPKVNRLSLSFRNVPKPPVLKTDGPDFRAALTA